MIALALVAVAPALLGRPFYTGDLLLYFYPLRRLLADGLAAGTLPAWGDESGCGMPLCADPQAICFDPAAPLYGLLDLGRALGAEAGLRLALMGLGTWVFLRGRRVPAERALLGAVPALLGGVTISLIGRLDKLGALSCMPWAFAAADRLAARSRGGFALMVGALALGGLSGGLEIWGMTLGGALLWAALAPGLGPEAGRRRAAAWTLLALGLALALTAVQWLPFAHLLRISSRGEGIDLAHASEMSAWPASLLGIGLPELFEDPASLGTRLYPGAPSELWYMEVMAPGWLTLVLAGRALYAPDPGHRAAARVLGAMSAVAAVLALGTHTPLYALLYDHVPGFSLWRYPGKFLIPLGFSLPAMAGLGLAAPLSSRARRGLAWGGLGLGALGVLLAFTLRSALAEALRGLAGAGTLEGWQLWCQRVGLGLTLHGMALAGSAALLGERPIGVRLAALVLAADLLLMHLDVNPPGPAGLVEPGPNAALMDPGTRFLSVSDTLGDQTIRDQGGLEDRLVRFRASLYPDMGALDGLEHVESQRAIRPALTWRLMKDVHTGDPAPELRTAEMVGAGVVLTSRALDDEVMADWPGAAIMGSPGLGGHLWRLGRAAPRIYRTERAVGWERSSDIARAVASGAQDPRVLSVVDASLPRGPSSEGEDRWDDGTLRLLRRAPGLWRAEVEGERPGWVALLETWDQGWKAEIDGVEAPVLRAQAAFLAVAVPAGSHVVTLRYEAPGRRAGLGLSALTLLLCAGWGFHARRRA